MSCIVISTFSVCFMDWMAQLHFYSVVEHTQIIGCIGYLPMVAYIFSTRRMCSTHSWLH